MSFDKQVSETCKACYFHIRVLRHIRASLTTEASKTIAAAIVGSRLDSESLWSCHITPVLFDLHWLPVRHRITFKIATVTFGILQFQQPTYLASLIPKYVPARALRSASVLSICVPPRKTTIAASKSFSSVASGIWNALPNHMSFISTLPAFRRALKHHLFLFVYPDSSAKSSKTRGLRRSLPLTHIGHA